MAEEKDETISPEILKQHKTLQAQMDEFEKQLKEAQNDQPALPSNVTQLDMKNFEELIHSTVKEALKGQTVIDRKFGALPGDTPEDIAKMDKKERCLRFLKAVFFKDHAMAVKLGGGDLKEKQLSEGTTTAGGYLVPEEFRAEVLRLANIYGLARRQCRIVPMARDKVDFPSAGDTGISTYWVSEAGTIASSTPNFGQVQLDAKKCCGLTILSNELVADAAVDILDYLMELFGEAIAKAEDTQWLAGTGSPVTGILGSGSVNTVTMDAGKTGFANIDFEDVRNMIYAVIQAARVGGQFYLHGDILNSLQGERDNEGRYIWLPPSQGRGGTIWGYPYNETDVMPGISSSAKETKFVAFGNPRYTLFGDRRRITIDTSTDAYVDTTKLFQTDQMAIRVIERVDIQLALPAAYAALKTAAA